MPEKAKHDRYKEIPKWHFPTYMYAGATQIVLNSAT